MTSPVLVIFKEILMFSLGFTVLGLIIKELDLNAVGRGVATGVVVVTDCVVVVVTDGVVVAVGVVVGVVVVATMVVVVVGTGVTTLTP